MKIDVDGKTIQVFFEYGSSIVTRKSGLFPVRVTLCGVREVPEEGPLQDGTKLAEGVAICSPDDNFDKAQGRKRALDRALRDPQISPFANDKVARRRIWHEYLQTHRYTEGRGPMSAEDVERIEARLAGSKKALAEASLRSQP